MVKSSELKRLVGGVSIPRQKTKLFHLAIYYQRQLRLGNFTKAFAVFVAGTRCREKTLVTLAADNACAHSVRLAHRSRVLATHPRTTRLSVLLRPLPLVAMHNACGRSAPLANAANALRRHPLDNSPADGAARPPSIPLRAPVPPTVRRLRPVGGRNALRPCRRGSRRAENRAVSLRERGCGRRG
jgi:hypothetical protein